jgi:large subunit ribosomal protein L1
VLPAGTG